MNAVLCFTFRFLDPEPQFRGRGGDGDPEWPPSPLRMFQALVSSAATRWREQQFRDYARPALQWLETIRPSLVAPPVSTAQVGYRMYVPNNSGDLMTAAWARGGTDTSMAKFRVEKDVRPTRLRGEAVHYFFPLADEMGPYYEVLQAAARSVTHLGWGVDMVAGNADVLSDDEADAKLPGHRWRPVPSGGTPLRVPVAGTLDGLVEKHTAFLGRLGPDGFRPVRPLSAFAVVGYDCPAARTDRPAETRPFAAFQILDADGEKVRSFDTARRARDVAAWVRHATGEACAGWPFESVEQFVHGHDETGKQIKGGDADRRFAYLPVPTINHALGRVEAVRRVLVVAPPGCRDRLDWARRRLAGQELVWADRPVGMLNLLPTSDWVLRQYTGTADVWSTVTPVILPGYDDRDPRKAERLLRNAFIHAGFSPETVAGIVDLEWRAGGFRAGTDLAGNYARPDKLTGSAYHVRVRFPHPVRGPLAVGAGRYRGLGLFAVDS